MANLTLNIDAKTLREARIRALQRGTSVNALVRAYLEQLARGGGQRTPLARFVELAERSQASSGDAGRTWTREEIHER